MRKVFVKCPEEICDELERLTYELSMEGNVIDRYLDRHFSDTAALDAPIFKKYMESVAEKTTKYELMKEKITQEVLTDLKDHEIEWNLNFLTEEIEVKILCDCEIPWIDNE